MIVGMGMKGPRSNAKEGSPLPSYLFYSLLLSLSAKLLPIA